MTGLFIILQIILLFFMLFHDWIPVPPFNNVEDLKKVDSNKHLFIGSCINGLSVLIPLLITIKIYNEPKIPVSDAITISAFYFCLTVGTILSWWTPYFFGSSPQHKQRFMKFKNTHHFLPPRGDHVVPNTLHVVLHLQVWACLVFSLWLLKIAIYS